MNLSLRKFLNDYFKKENNESQFSHLATSLGYCLLKKSLWNFYFVELKFLNQQLTVQIAILYRCTFIKNGKVVQNRHRAGQ